MEQEWLAFTLFSHLRFYAVSKLKITLKSFHGSEHINEKADGHITVLAT